jgi:hypothetical protein
MDANSITNVQGINWPEILRYVLPSVIVVVAIFASAVIASLHNLFDTVMKAVEDKKVDEAEFEDICAKAKAVKDSIYALVKNGLAILLRFKK